MPKLLSRDVNRRLNELAVEELQPSQILDTLVEEGYEPIPDIRTIQRRVKAFNKSRTPEDAQLDTVWFDLREIERVGARPDEVQLLLGLLRHSMSMSGPKGERVRLAQALLDVPTDRAKEPIIVEGAPVPLTLRLAGWAIRIHRAAPDLPVPQLFEIASNYSIRERLAALEPPFGGNGATADLDMYLAFQPWKGQAEKKSYQEFLLENYPQYVPPFLFHAVRRLGVPKAVDGIRVLAPHDALGISDNEGESDNEQ